VLCKLDNQSYKHTHKILIIAFPWHQWLHKHAWMLYLHCLSCVLLSLWNLLFLISYRSLLELLQGISMRVYYQDISRWTWDDLKGLVLPTAYLVHHMHNLRFPLQWCWGFKSLGFSCWLAGLLIPSILKGPTTFMLRSPRSTFTSLLMLFELK